MRLAALMISPCLILGCDSPKSAPPPTPEPAAAPAGHNAEPAKAPAPLAPAPQGTVTIAGLYVHTCADPKSCPAMFQDAGSAHCGSVTLASLSWRLPTLAELEGWTGKPELRGFDVFHWSGSPWQEDAGQMWIFDPGSGSKTTAKPDRKAFTIRCVAAAPRA